MSPIPDTSYIHTLLSSPPSSNPSAITSTIENLNLQPHPEGGFFTETDRSTHTVPNPFLNSPLYPNATSNENAYTESRTASTTIFYFLAPTSPLGHFHRNKARTVHTLHSGRGRYVVLHPDETDETTGQKPRMETFIVGHDVAKGEKLQWIVDGGKWKCSFLLSDVAADLATVGEQGKGSESGLLISETVVPGFEFSDHDFLTAEGLKEMVGEERGAEMKWMLLEGEQRKWEEVNGK